jgi:Protein of unknown function (DUF3551)
MVMAMSPKRPASLQASAAKKIAFMSGIVLLTSLAGTAAHAQNYPWCAQYTGSMGGSMNCGFTTWAQCQADVSGIGGFCIRNDTYRAPTAARSRK